MSSNPGQTTQQAGHANPASAQPASNIINALGNAFRTPGGDPLSNDKVAQLLLANMGQLGELARQGKLTEQQIAQLKDYADKHKAQSHANATAQNGQAAGPSRQQSQPAQSPVVANPHMPPAGFKNSSPAPVLNSTPQAGYPISATLSTTPQHNRPVDFPLSQASRPTLSGGIPGGRISGTPAMVAPQADDVSLLSMDNIRTRRKSATGDQSLRRTIQDLVSSVDPNVKIEPEVEDILLNIADEFIDSVTNFGCRLARHRGGDTLEVRDLQLHLERNHNIRIPGFASDETRISLSQSSVGAPAAPAATAAAAGKKGAGPQTGATSVRNARLAQVQQAKREAKLM